MKITKEADYAIRIVDYLARKGGLAGSVEISEEASVPLRFAKNILQKLVRSGIINSYKGIHGGYELGKLPEDISLYDVLEATDGPVALNLCQQQNYECAYRPKEQCGFCRIFKKMSQEMEEQMRKVCFSAVVYDESSEL